MNRSAPRIRILLGSTIAMGPGKADLLEAIDESGSISGAARAMGMSYRRAWQLVDVMNQAFNEPLVDTATGGKGGGGARVTSFGLAILQRYRAMEGKAQQAIAQDLEEFVSHLKSRPT